MCATELDTARPGHPERRIIWLRSGCRRTPAEASAVGTAEAILPYNLPYKTRRPPSWGVVSRLDHPWSSRFPPSGPVQKNPSDRIISAAL